MGKLSSRASRNIVLPTGKMSPDQLQARLSQNAVRIPHKHRQDSVKQRNEAQSRRGERNPRGFDD